MNSIFKHPDVVLQFAASVEQKQNEIEELTGRLELEVEKHEQSIALLQKERQLKLDEVLTDRQTPVLQMQIHRSNSKEKC